jgi:three-Cys-motif partner protein
MATHNRKLLLIDGFAGPGRYSGGEEGSPLVMVRSLLDHSQLTRIEPREISFIFVEADRRRHENLVGEVQAVAPRLPANTRVLPILGSFTDVAERLLGEVQNLVPTFAFIDPFGYRDTRMPTTGRILSFPRCEVLIYLPIPFLTRFVGRAGQEAAFNSLYGSEAWRAAIPLQGQARKRLLHDLFRDALQQHATFVRSFEIVTAEGGGYHLFFASNNVVGLKKMKEAMWSVDPVAGTSFRDSTVGPQLVLFEPEPDTLPLLHALQDKFGGEQFTIEQAQDFTTLETPFLDDRHLKRRTLRPAERDGLLVVGRGKARAGTFPPRTLLRFAGQ